MPICQSMFLKLYVCPSVHGQYVLDIQSLYYSGLLFTHFMKVWYGAPKLPSLYFSKTHANGVYFFTQKESIRPLLQNQSKYHQKHQKKIHAFLTWTKHKSATVTTHPVHQPGWAPTGKCSISPRRKVLNLMWSRPKIADREKWRYVVGLLMFFRVFVDNFGWIQLNTHLSKHLSTYFIYHSKEAFTLFPIPA